MNSFKLYPTDAKAAQLAKFISDKYGIDTKGIAGYIELYLTNAFLAGMIAGAK